jgi:hypothetical protein
MKHFGFKNEADPWRKNEKHKPDNSDDTQISRPDLRFASRESSEQTQKGAGATPKKTTLNSPGLPPTR